VQDSLAIIKQAEEVESLVVREAGVDYNVQDVVAQMEREMLEAADALEFERAALLRDQLNELRHAHGMEAKQQPQSVRYDRKPARARTPRKSKV